MFKSKSSEPNVEISIQAIQEDMMTFAHPNLCNSIGNKQRLVEDIKNNMATNEIDTNLWFSFFNVFKSQNNELESTLTSLQNHREELEFKRSEIECDQLILKKDIESCLNNVRKAKSPE
ncbi:hypothetical protein ACKWTF_004815 [Chironomus riparius]